MELIQSIAAWIGTNAPYLIGFLLPPFVQVLNRDIPENGRSKFIVTTIVCFLVAVILNWRTIFAETDWGSVEATLATFSFILAQSEIAYRLYFKNSALQQRIIVSMSAEAPVAPATP